MPNGTAHGLAAGPEGGRYLAFLAPPAGQARRPYALAAGEGDGIDWPGVELVVKADIERTAGSITVIEDTSDAMTVPWHVHQDDEAFYVLDGRYRFLCGDDELEAGPGDFAFLPRGVPHEQHVLDDRSRKLMVLTPAGLEGFFRGMAAAFREGMTPDKRDALAATHRLRFL